MPAASKYSLDKNSTTYQANESEYIAEITKRVKEYDRAWKYYEGMHDPQLKEQKDGRDDNVVLNEVGILADKHVSFLVGDGVNFRIMSQEDTESMRKFRSTDDIGSQISQLEDIPENEFTASVDDEGASTQDTAQLQEDEKVIISIVKENRDLIMLLNLALIGSVEGQCTVQIAPGDRDPEYPGEQIYTSIRPIEGRHFTAFWDPFDKEKVLWYRLQHIAGVEGARTGVRIDYVKGEPVYNDRQELIDWDHDKPVWYEIIYRAEHVTSTQTTPLTGKQSPIDWRMGAEPVLWDYSWPPIVTWQNLPNPRSFYGKSDIKSAIKLNDHLNFLLSNALRIVKHFGDPKTIGIGFNADDIKMGVGGLMTVSKPDAKIFNLEMQGDLASTMSLIDTIRFALWQIGGQVDPRAVKDSVGHLTNFALRVMFLDAIKTVDKKRMLYEEGLKKVIGRAMQLMGRKDPRARLDLEWSDILPVDTQKVVETLLEEFREGIISKRTYRERRGWVHEKEEQRIDEEGQSNSPGQDILANMLQSNRALAQSSPIDDSGNGAETGAGEEGTF